MRKNDPCYASSTARSGLQLVDHHPPVAVADAPAIAPLILALVCGATFVRSCTNRLIARATAPPVFRLKQSPEDLIS